MIEHLEPSLSPWVMLEYKHIAKIVGKENIIFANVSKPSDRVRLSPIASEVKEESVKKMDLSRACVLDPTAMVPLSPKDKEKFDILIIGGILGQDPMINRTRKAITSKVVVSSRNLGPMQMSTDTAVYVAKQIVENNKELQDLPFIDKVEIPIEPGLSLTLPYRYIKVNGEPLMSPGLVEYLKKRKTI